MYSLTERLEKLRENAFNWKTTQTDYIGQRIYGALEGLTSINMDSPWMLVRAQMLAGVITHSKPIIKEKELIVGYNREIAKKNSP